MNFGGALASAVASVAAAGGIVAVVFGWRRRTTGSASEHGRTEHLDERFIAIGGQLSDPQPALRLAGVLALADLADDWEENRQACIDVLCGYLRIPYEPDRGAGVTAPEQAEFRASREVRHTVIRVIAEHLREEAALSWQGSNFDFTGAVFDGGDFSGAVFSGGMVSFDRAEFCGATVRFNLTEFCGASVSFDRARFPGGTVYFGGAVFSGGRVSFDGAAFTDAMVRFDYAAFSGGAVSFEGAEFSGGNVSFDGVEFSGGTVSLDRAGFSGTGVHFARALFSGGTVRFDGALYLDATVDFTEVAEWSYPPTLGGNGIVPSGIIMPAKGRAAQS